MELRILGRTQVVRDGDEIALGGTQRRSLLAVLLLDPGVVVPAERLVEALWPVGPPMSAAQTVQSHVSHLRKLLGADRIETLSGGYRLVVEDAEVDSIAFERELERGRVMAGSGDAASAVGVLDVALSRWRGAAFEDADGCERAVAESARLDGLRTSALELLLDARLALGQHDRVAADAELAVRQWPLRERLWAALITALYRCGRHADALSAYQRLRTMLAEELGLEPSPSIVELEARILRHDPSLLLPQDPAPATTSPQEDERLSQTGALGTLDASSGNLPVQLTSFVGREDEVEQITAVFTERRLVTITGVGGVGKTRLSLQIAAELLPRFPHGAWACELAAATDADTMLGMVATTLAVKPRTGMGMDEAVLQSLRDKELLVVLDNCEHLLSAAGSLVDGLMRRCAGVCVLATSREGLGVNGEQVWPLRSLTVPDESADLETVGGSAAVQLFTDRAGAVRPDFTLDDSNISSVVEICRRLDGIPLALELAAARVAAMSPSEIAQLLDERFRLLTGGRRTAVERHQTLRAAVDWSYSLLDAVERLVFDRLSVFAGGFDAASAAAVVSADGVEEWDVRDALLALVAKSLVVADTTAEGGTRYQMLETLRQYARERLDASGATDGWRRRHAEHFAGFAEVVGPELSGADELRWRRRVGVELENLRAAVTWALEGTEPGDAELAVGIIAELGGESTMHRTSGVARWAENALERLADTTPGRRAAVLGAAGFGATFRGDFATASALAEQALREEITPDFPGPNHAVIVSCLAMVNAGEAPAAVEQALRYAEHFDRIGLRGFHSCNLRTTAAIWALYSGDHETAKEQSAVALEVAKEIANPSSLAICSFVAGWTLASEAPEAALGHLERSVALTRSGAGDVVLSATLTQIARIRARQGQREASWAALSEAIAHSHRDGDETGLAGWIDEGVIVIGSLGAPEAAAVLAGSVLDGTLARLLLATPFETTERDQCLEGVRDELGDERFDAAFERGAAMSYEDVVAYALDQLGPSG